MRERGNAKTAEITPERAGDARSLASWQVVHAWCLMSNHFHLVSETPRGNLVGGMKWLLGVYTNRFR